MASRWFFSNRWSAAESRWRHGDGRVTWCAPRETCGLTWGCWNGRKGRDANKVSSQPASTVYHFSLVKYRLRNDFLKRKVKFLWGKVKFLRVNMTQPPLLARRATFVSSAVSSAVSVGKDVKTDPEKNVFEPQQESDVKHDQIQRNGVERKNRAFLWLWASTRSTPGPEPDTGLHLSFTVITVISSTCTLVECF